MNTVPDAVKAAKSITYQYLSNDKRTKLVLILFGIYALINVIAPFIDIYFLTVLNNTGTPPTDIGKLHDTLTGWSSLFYLLSAVIFLFWVYRANNNAHALNPEKVFEFTPRWNVGSYFIPIISLYWPYKAMKELWSTITTDRDTKLLIVWWVTFLLMNFMINVVAKLSVDTISEIDTYVIMCITSQVTGFIAAVTGIMIVKRINTEQDAASKKNRGFGSSPNE